MPELADLDTHQSRVSEVSATYLYKWCECSGDGLPYNYCQRLEIPLSLGSHCRSWEHHHELDDLPPGKSRAARLGVVPVNFTVHLIDDSGVKLSFDEHGIYSWPDDNGHEVLQEVVTESGIVLIPRHLLQGGGWIPRHWSSPVCQLDTVAVADIRPHRSNS